MTRNNSRIALLGLVFLLGIWAGWKANSFARRDNYSPEHSGVSELFASVDYSVFDKQANKVCPNVIECGQAARKCNAFDKKRRNCIMKCLHIASSCDCDEIC